MLKSSFVRVCLASAVAIVAVAASVRANHSWGGYHWARTENPVVLQVGSNLSAQWYEYLVTAESKWEIPAKGFSPVLDLTIVPGSSTRNCKPKAGRLEVCNSAYGFNGWLGIAQIWITGGVHITQATTKLNDSYFNTATYNSTAWRNLVMCQEVGHGFGLAHQDENFNNANLGSCMDYTSSPSTNQSPNGHDYEQLVAIYNHRDSFTSASTTRLPVAMPPAMGLIDVDNPANWGERVHRSANGRQETFELDFGNGNKVVTEVFWADPAADEHQH